VSEPYLAEPDLTLYNGDSWTVLRGLPDESIDCCVTSPPYWGLRDYGTGSWEGGDPECDHARPTTTMNVGFNERWGQGAGERKQEHKSDGQYPSICAKCGAHRLDKQLGLEPNVRDYVFALDEIFDEVKRVLTPHATLWLNLGDTFAANRSYQVPDQKYVRMRENRGSMGVPEGLKPKDLVGVPWRVAFALQESGWWLRMDNIWNKANPMPESAKDRPTRAHEYVFLLSKSKNYFYDYMAVQEPATWDRWGDQTSPKYDGQEGMAGAWIKEQAKETLQNRNMRNMRSVWTIPTQPYGGEHFATFPEKLVSRCLLASCPQEVCRTCGKPRERIVETDNPSKEFADDGTMGWSNTHQQTSNPQSSQSLHRNPGGVYASARDLGFTDCGHNDYRPGVVLDPFAGAGTTALVARKLSRSSVLIELNPDYCKIISERLAAQPQQAALLI
jgi:DNA modification methylase